MLMTQPLEMCNISPSPPTLRVTQEPLGFLDWWVSQGQEYKVTRYE